MAEQLYYHGTDDITAVDVEIGKTIIFGRLFENVVRQPGVLTLRLDYATRYAHARVRSLHRRNPDEFFAPAVLTFQLDENDVRFLGYVDGDSDIPEFATNFIVKPDEVDPVYLEKTGIDLHSDFETRGILFYRVPRETLREVKILLDR